MGVLSPNLNLTHEELQQLERDYREILAQNEAVDTAALDNGMREMMSGSRHGMLIRMSAILAVQEAKQQKAHPPSATPK